MQMDHQRNQPSLSDPTHDVFEKTLAYWGSIRDKGCMARLQEDTQRTEAEKVEWDIIHRSPLSKAKRGQISRVTCQGRIQIRCNQHIFLLKKNEQDDEVLDFVKYKAWTPDRLNILCEHNSRASATTSFHRGQKVTGWGEGSMTGWGARLPAGGAPGDGYDIYKGMAISDQGSVEEGIDLFHNHAEDALVLEETARVIYPSLVRKLKDDTTDCGRVGRYGATMYRAVNYIAGIHSEGDAGHGLCCQLEWFGKKEWDEFAFVYLAYGVYFVTEANMLCFPDVSEEKLSKWHVYVEGKGVELTNHPEEKILTEQRNMFKLKRDKVSEKQLWTKYLLC
ncbi:hypothetical protein K435DRAFT_806543 [Dendrothele bispora CBS 962.96]|uniref:Uncharacterized protein n=1 Tax=Dendrothele bispora (strain CBS 962.96) TaxID=1314807 RepID=A0A4V4HCU3_DENBC|nr:hypothetical protein K435DRAFT_806543 [Dendrothele bispora CBS 962.96]